MYALNLVFFFFFVKVTEEKNHFKKISFFLRNYIFHHFLKIPAAPNKTKKFVTNCNNGISPIILKSCAFLRAVTNFLVLLGAAGIFRK